MIYELKNKINIHYTPLEQILFNRDIPEEQMKHFLEVNENDICPLFMLKNIDAGVKMLINHIGQGDKIFIQIDSDCDGFTSSAFLMNYLHRHFPWYVENNFTYRVHDDKSHGLIFETIPEGTKLVIIPDAGSNDYEEHKKCADAGIDVLVLDHHESDRESEYACVINNQMCDYPTKSLSGVGIVYKFCSQIDSIAGTDYANDYLDLVSLGLIADVMDTRDFETQYLIQEGLKRVKNPFFKGMINKDQMHFNSEKVPLMNDVAWYVAPFVNAVTRVGTAEEKYLLFDSLLEYKAYTQIPSTKRGCKGQMETVVEQACRTVTNVKNRQNDAIDAALEVIEQSIAENNSLKNQVLIIIYPGGTKNLNGLVANKLANKYQRPVLVLQEVKHIDDENGIYYSYEGSARGYDKSELKDFKQFLDNSSLVEYTAGHKNAFGVGILQKNINSLQEYCNEYLEMGDIKYEVDFIWQANEINSTDVISIASYKHLWGQKVDEPLIALENVRLTDNNVSFIGRTGKTLRINNDQYSIIKFFCSDDEKEALTTNGETWTANLIVTCDLNEWGGRTSPQFKLVDFEIVNKQKWVF